MTSTVDVETSVAEPPARPVSHKLEFTKVNTWRKIVRTIRFIFSVRSRVKKGSVLCMTIGGALADQRPQRSLLSPPNDVPNLPEVITNLRNAAHDPRVSAVYIKIEPVSCGYAKLEEIRRHLDYFRQSGKKVIAYMQIGGEKEYFIGLSADEVYAPPEAFISLRGFRVSGAFIRGVLDKIGVLPQVQRIGKYKSAGDQFARTTMSEAQREVLESLLNEQFTRFVQDVAAVRGKSEAEVEELLNNAPQEVADYVKGGWITDVKYESEVIDMLKENYNNGDTSEKKLKRPLKAVNSRKYSRVSAKTLGLQGKSVIAIIRANGAITLGKNSRNPVTGATVGSDSFIELVRTAIQANYIKAVVVRIDSPGGVSLAADVMWEELKRLSAKKPVIASMVDVAASGGYYMAMACDKIVAEDLTITGSIGVVSTKLSLKEIYDKIGFSRENISKGRYAEFDVDNRPFTQDEAAYFEHGAQLAYKSFVSKAAESRGKDYDSMHALAQGRVWTGRQGIERGLVDELGGITRAIELAKEKAGIKDAGKIVELQSRKGFAGLGGLLSSTGENEMNSLRTNLNNLGDAEILCMAEFDGTDTNPVMNHLMGKVLTAIPKAGLNMNMLKDILSRILQ